MSKKQGSPSAMQQRVNAEIQDNLDEDLELELEDSDLADLLADGHSLRENGAFPRHLYFKELLRLQRELIKLQDWVVAKKLKLVVIFEGRDAAGKGGVIKRVTQRLNPRVCRAVALLGAERARAQPVVFPALCPPSSGRRRDRAVRPQLVQPRRRRARDGLLHRRGIRGLLPVRAGIREALVRSGIILVKYWFSISDDEQNLRFLMRINDPLKQWKLSPMDLESRRRWELYTKAKETMLERTHIPEAPWWVIEAVDKKRARLNCIAHLLTRVSYQEVQHEKPILPARVHSPEYHRTPTPPELIVPDHYANLVREYAK